MRIRYSVSKVYLPTLKNFMFSSGISRRTMSDAESENLDIVVNYRTTEFVSIFSSQPMQEVYSALQTATGGKDRQSDTMIHSMSD